MGHLYWELAVQGIHELFFFCRLPHSIFYFSPCGPPAFLSCLEWLGPLLSVTETGQGFSFSFSFLDTQLGDSLIIKGCPGLGS